jgi:hypothetical protein
MPLFTLPTNGSGCPTSIHCCLPLGSGARQCASGQTFAAHLTSAGRQVPNMTTVSTDPIFQKNQKTPEHSDRFASRFVYLAC